MQDRSRLHTRESHSPLPVACHLHKRKMSGPKIEHCGTPHDNSPGDEELCPCLRRKLVFLVRYDRNQNMTESAKPKYFNFSRKISWSVVSNAF